VPLSAMDSGRRLRLTTKKSDSRKNTSKEMSGVQMECRRPLSMVTAPASTFGRNRGGTGVRAAAVDPPNARRVIRDTAGFDVASVPQGTVRVGVIVRRRPWRDLRTNPGGVAAQTAVEVVPVITVGLKRPDRGRAGSVAEALLPLRLRVPLDEAQRRGRGLLDAAFVTHARCLARACRTWSEGHDRERRHGKAVGY